MKKPPTSVLRVTFDPGYGLISTCAHKNISHNEESFLKAYLNKVHTVQHIIFTAKNEQSELIEGLIESGDYKTKNDVITAALKLLDGRESAKLQRLRRLIEEGENSGEAVEVNGDTLLQEIKSAL